MILGTCIAACASKGVLMADEKVGPMRKAVEQHLRG
jgi:hypothetical protein